MTYGRDRLKKRERESGLREKSSDNKRGGYGRMGLVMMWNISVIHKNRTFISL